ncbi:MAG TPA: ELWxxDGT repeat protein, partial [Geobacteraceae bacterium]
MLNKIICNFVLSFRSCWFALALSAFFILMAFSQASAISQPLMVKDINASAAGTTSGIGSFVTIGAITYFGATDGINGQELWRTDGTEVGTFMVTDINPGGNSSNP